MNDTDRSLGVFGGAFNPVHNGHLAVAEAALREPAIERVLFVPSGRPPHKPGRQLAPAADRLAMLRLVLHDTPACEVSEIEVRRKGTSYTIDTVNALRHRVGEAVRIAFLIGADTIGELCTWHRIEELVARCDFVPFPRPGVDLDAARRRLADCLGRERADAVCDRLIDMEPVAVSSTDIRARAAAGRSLRGRVPDPVADYIAAHGLYRGG